MIWGTTAPRVWSHATGLLATLVLTGCFDLGWFCGNAHLDGDEQCDDGNYTDGDGCDNNCTFTGPRNGVVTVGEQCDDGNETNGDGCDNNATPTGCGNGIVTRDEVCDDGPANADDQPDACRTDCRRPWCGDGTLDSTEACDDGPANGTPRGCTNDCSERRGIEVTRWAFRPTGFNPAADFRDVQLYRGYLWIAAGHDGLYVVDGTDPATPSIVGTLTSDVGEARELAFTGDYAFVAAEGDGLLAVDITAPNAPRVVGQLELTDAQGVVTDGDYAYVANGAGGLAVVDIRDPKHLVMVSSLPNGEGGVARGVAKTGPLLWLADGRAGLLVVDVQNPKKPNQVGIGPMENTFSGGKQVAVQGNYAYVACAGDGVYVMDVSDVRARGQGNPRYVTAFDRPGYAEAVTLTDGVAYVANGDTGIWVLDISDPTRPTLIGAYDTPGSAHRVAMEGDVAWIADGNAGLHGVYAGSPSTPHREAVVELEGTQMAIDVRDNTAYLASDDAGMHLVSIDEANLPTNTHRYTMSGRVYGVALDVEGDYVYLANGDRGVAALEVTSAPDPPVQRPTYWAGIFDARNAALADVFIVIINDTGMAAIFNGTDDPPFQTPAFGSQLDLPGRDIALDASNTYGFVALEKAGLEVADFTYPFEPQPIDSRYEPEGWVQGVAVTGDRAYLAVGDDDLHILDISNPFDLTLAGYYDLPEEAWDVAVVGSYAYVANGSAGLVLVNIQPPTLELLETATETNGTVHTYQVGWVDLYENNPEEVRCLASGGTCEVSTMDQAAHRAIVRWHLPRASGRYKLLTMVGNQHYVNSTSAQVDVPPSSDQ